MTLFSTKYPNQERTVSGTYNVDPEDVILLCDTSTAPVIINLQDIPADYWNTIYKLYVIDNSGNSGTNTITIVPPASFTINNSASLLLNVNGIGCVVSIIANTKYIASLSYTLTPATNAFIQNGNSFGAIAVLGTNDAFPLRIETNGVTRAEFDLNGSLNIGSNVGSGTNNAALNIAKSIDGIVGSFIANTNILGTGAVALSAVTQYLSASAQANMAMVVVGEASNASGSQNDWGGPYSANLKANEKTKGLNISKMSNTYHNKDQDYIAFYVCDNIFNSNPAAKILYGGNVSGNQCAIVQSTPSSAVADADLNPGNVSFYLDESTNGLKWRAKYSNGTTLKTGRVILPATTSTTVGTLNSAPNVVPTDADLNPGNITFYTLDSEPADLYVRLRLAGGTYKTGVITVT